VSTHTCADRAFNLHAFVPNSPFLFLCFDVGGANEEIAELVVVVIRFTGPLGQEIFRSFF
jgi:hypothetical protein